MIIELIKSRGLGFYIDGQSPTCKEWGLGTDGLITTFVHTSQPPSHNRKYRAEHNTRSLPFATQRYVPFGDLKVSKLETKIGPGESPDDIWYDGDGTEHQGLPRKLILLTNRGTIEAAVTYIAIGGDQYDFSEKPEPEPEPDPGPESISAEMGNGSLYDELEDADEFNGGGGTQVTLADGTVREIDEYMAYIRAEN